MKKSRLLGAVCACVFCFISMSANATLIERLDGQAYYDDVLQITWTANANPLDRSLSWVDADAWVQTYSLGGHDVWRLPSMDVDTNGVIVDCWTASASACKDNELSYMFWENEVTAADPFPFTRLVDEIYWSSTYFGTGSHYVFNFHTGDSSDTHPNNSTGPWLWPVADGDVFAPEPHPVPEPPLLWLLVPGLLGLVGISRRKKAAS